MTTTTITNKKIAEQARNFIKNQLTKTNQILTEKHTIIIKYLNGIVSNTQLKTKEEYSAALNSDNTFVNICRNYVCDTFNSTMEKALTNFNITRSLNGLRFDYVFNTGKLYNGSDEFTKNAFINAIKYQVLAVLSKENTENTEDEVYISYLIWIYGAKLMKFINNEITHIDTGINSEVELCYNPLLLEDNFKECLQNVHKQIYEQKDYSVTTLNNQRKYIEINNQNKSVHNMKVLTVDYVTQLLDEFQAKYNRKPTIKELNEYYRFINQEKFAKLLEEDFIEFNRVWITDSAFRKYIITHHLDDRIESKKYK